MATADDRTAQALSPALLERGRRLRANEPVEDLPFPEELKREHQPEDAQNEFERAARLIGGGLVQGVGDIVSIPFSAADIAIEVEPLTSPEGGSHMGQGVRDMFGVPAAAIRGGVTPQNRGEKMANFLGEELGAGGPIAWQLRKMAVFRVGLGKANRFWQTLAERPAPIFYAEEFIGASGAAAGRLLGEQWHGVAGEVTGSIAGDLLARNFFPAIWRFGRNTKHFLGISFDTIAEQDDKYRKLAESLREEGGIERLASTEEGRDLLAEAAEVIQRNMGQTAEVEAGYKLIAEYEKMSRELGAHGDDLVMPSILENPGAASLVHESTARNPSLAVRLMAASKRGMAQIRRGMVRVGGLGPTVPANRVENATSVIQSEATRRIDDVAAQTAELEARKASGVAEADVAARRTIDPEGAFALDDAATITEKATLSARFSNAITDSWLKAKEELVTPLYDRVEVLAKEHANLRWSVNHSKEALADVRGPLREAGELDSANDLFGIIDAWPESGIDFARLRDLQKTLTKRIERLVAREEFVAADELRKLKDGVDKDIMEFELLEVDIPATPAGRAAPGAGAGPSESGTVGLQRDRSAETRRLDLEGSREKGEEILGLNERIGVDAQMDRTGKVTGTGLEGPFEGPSLRELSEAGGNAPARTLDDVRAEERSLREFMSTAEDPSAASRARVRLNALQTEREAIVARMRQPEGPATKGRPAKGKRGTRDQGGISDDTAKGLANERSRQIVTEAMTEANNAHRKLAGEYYDPIATGSILKAHRTHNPVPHSEQLGLFLKPGKAYTERVGELLARIKGDPELETLARNWLIADAYQRTVRNVDLPDGSTTPRLDRRKFDDWKRANALAINGVPGMKSIVDDTRELVVKAKQLGAVPVSGVPAANVQALNKYVSDPEKFFDGLASMGVEEARKAVKDVMTTIRASGDLDAIDGFARSFVRSRLIRKFTSESAGTVTPQQSLKAMQEVIDTPALRETMITLFGEEHVRLIEYGIRLQKGAIEIGKIPGRVAAERLATPGEAFREFTTKSSAYNVIMGKIRRTAKMSQALLKFQRSTTLLQRNAIIDEAWMNKPLLRDLLTRDPTDKTFESIKYHMGLAHPTIFPRAKRNQKLLQEQEEERQKDEEAQDVSANRAIVSPPRTSLLSPPIASFGQLG
jgi:hypothetical protein